MNILQIISTLNPQYGGPVEVVRQTNDILVKCGHSVEIVTLDHANAPWIDEIAGCAYALGPSKGRYCFNRRLIPWLKAHSRKYDAILVHGIWQFQSFGTWLARNQESPPYFVYVHGALSPWFKRAQPLKHLKKWLYWPWAEYRVLRDAQAVLFACNEERVLSRKSFWLYKVNETVIDYGLADPLGGLDEQREQFFRSFPFLRNKRLLLYLGRIDRVKGCDLLIQALSKVAERYPDLHLVMAGSDYEGSQKKLLGLAKTCRVEDRITWTGMLTGDIKWGAFHAAEVFVLPSHSENFGIVVAEALACGLPVLITDKVNIWREIVQDGAGFAEPDTLDGTVTLLTRWLGLPAEEVRKMRERARGSFEHRFDIRQGAKKLIDVIDRGLSMRSGKPMPSVNIPGQECKP